jgi:hypothetical protein
LRYADLREIERANHLASNHLLFRDDNASVIYIGRIHRGVFSTTARCYSPDVRYPSHQSRWAAHIAVSYSRSFSYAVYAGHDLAEVVQFRSDYFDQDTAQLAQSIFGNFVVEAIRHGHT